MTKIVLIGDTGSGKTQLLNKITGKKFNLEHKPTDGIECYPYNHLYIWDRMGGIDNQFLFKTYCKNAVGGIYCIDLSKTINVEDINKNIKLFKKTSPGIPLILVGTKSDLVVKEKKEEIERNFNAIEIDEGEKRIITSAKEEDNTKNNIEELTNIICSIRPQNSELIELHQTLNSGNQIHEKDNEQTNPLWEQAYQKLNAVIKKDLSNDKYLEMLHIINTLMDNLKNTTIVDKTASLEKFSTDSHVALEGNYPNTLNAIATLVASISVAIVAAIIGYGIGFAFGAWTGPGAFLSGFIAGNAAAVSVVAVSGFLGLGTTALAGWGLFRKTREVKAIEEFTTEITESLKT